MNNAMSYYRKQKREILQKIKTKIEENDPMEKEKLQAKIEVEYGSSQEAIERYLNTLENAGEIVRNGSKYSVVQ